jgi:excinuclease UvrABC nuclease subunit
MPNTPSWFTQLKWSGPYSIATVNAMRAVIPEFTGCYAFTTGAAPLSPGRVLYVGEAAEQSLRRRLAVYLIDYSVPKVHESHKGKGFVLEARKRFGDHAVHVRWVEYGASPADIHILEASLISYLNPAANDRQEEHRHPVLGDDERLDRRLIR